MRQQKKNNYYKYYAKYKSIVMMHEVWSTLLKQVGNKGSLPATLTN